LSKTAITYGTFEQRSQVVEAIRGVDLVIPGISTTKLKQSLKNFPVVFKSDILKVFEIPGALRRDLE
jgi:glycerol-3-phosphate cytidylyltransferase-like family protein